MTRLRWIAVFYAIALLIAAAFNYIPGLTDHHGRALGIFALDIFDDLLHILSATWAAVAAFISHRAAQAFLLYFGALYFGDGLMGLVTGSGYLDLGIVKYGVQDFPFYFKVLANLPHLALGGFAMASVFLFGKQV
jgi:hypothetical protein